MRNMGIRILMLLLVLAQTSFGQIFDRYDMYNRSVDSYYNQFKETSDEYSLDHEGLKGRVKYIREIDSTAYNNNLRKFNYSELGYLESMMTYKPLYYNQQEKLNRVFNYSYSDSVLTTITESVYNDGVLINGFKFSYGDDAMLDSAVRLRGLQGYKKLPLVIEYNFKWKKNTLKMTKNMEKDPDHTGASEPLSILFEFDSIGRLLKESTTAQFYPETRSLSYSPNSVTYSSSSGYSSDRRVLVCDGLGRVTHSRTRYSGINHRGDYTGERNYVFAYDCNGLLAQVTKFEENSNGLIQMVQPPSSINDSWDLLNNVNPPNIERFNYKFDKNGNWINLIVSDVSGNFLREVNRTITYYE